jgi:hypothetical protein
VNNAWIALTGLTCLTPFAFSQPTTRPIDFNNHLWYSYSGDHPASGRWGIHVDGQWRRADLGGTWQQYQLRPGLNFKVSDAVQVTLGYAFTKSFPYGDFPANTSTPEHRIYQQALLKHSWRSVQIQHRTRLEQRFIRYPDPQLRSWTYQNRFRYLFKADIPLVTDGSGRAALYLPVFNEVLIGIPPNYGARLFDQNRFFLGLGRALDKAKIEVGYMNQFIGQRNGRIFEFNNTVFITVTSDAPISSLWGD